MNCRIASIGSCILMLFAGGCIENRLAPSKQQEPINHAGDGVGTNSFESICEELDVTAVLDQIELLYSVNALQDAKGLNSALKGHLFAAMDIVDANERLFPSTVAVVRSNQDFIAATACRRTDLWTNQHVIRVSSGSPLRHTEAEFVRLAKSVQATRVHDFEGMVLDGELANLEVYLVLTQRTGKDFDRDRRKIADFLISELNVADAYIEKFPKYAPRIRNNASYRAAKEWRKHVRVTY